MVAVDTPKNASPTKDQMAVVVIDGQIEFFSPQSKNTFSRGSPQTLEVAATIRQQLDAFREAGIPVYWVYAASSGTSLKDVDFGETGGPRAGETVIPKSEDSAFTSSILREVLERDGRTHLFVCGFYTSWCLSKTSLHALSNKFNVCVLDDMTENGVDCHPKREVALKRLEKAGATVRSSAQALD